MVYIDSRIEIEITFYGSRKKSFLATSVSVECSTQSKILLNINSA